MSQEFVRNIKPHHTHHLQFAIVFEKKIYTAMKSHVCIYTYHKVVFICRGYVAE